MITSKNFYILFSKDFSPNSIHFLNEKTQTLKLNKPYVSKKEENLIIPNSNNIPNSFQFHQFYCNF